MVKPSRGVIVCDLVSIKNYKPEEMQVFGKGVLKMSYRL
jgi:hypothetical protein